MQTNTEYDEMIFETVDKDYNTVSLSKSTWENHIVSAHPEMAGSEGDVQQTVENADNTTQDSQRKSRYYYMAHNNHSLSPYGTLIKVCVSIESGSTKSAYCTDYVSSKEIEQ